MVAQADRRRAERLAVRRPVAVDDDDRVPPPQGDHPPPGLQQLLLRQAILRVRVLADGPVHVVPDVHGPLADHEAKIVVAEDLFEVLAGDGAGGAEDDAVLAQAVHAL